MKKERTFVIIKPDGVQRSLIGEIIGRVERTGLKFIGMKMVVPTKEQCWEHYQKDDAWFLAKGTKIVEDRKKRGAEVNKEPIEYGKEIIDRLVKYLTCGPVVCFVIEGNQSVGIVKKLVGSTEPLTSDVGTIRGDLTLDSYPLADLDSRAVRNLIHCTDKPEEAEREINLWFKKEELMNYRLVQEAILYDVNIDGILE
jgi:nucleoside-diphosphate kinase